MAGLPVTIRLLDPPLHEFLPPPEQVTDERTRRRVRQLQESNPMLGTRGCRLGLQWPEIYEMQARAIVRAARAVDARTGEAPLVEIMHPLAGCVAELPRLRELTGPRPGLRVVLALSSAARAPRGRPGGARGYRGRRVCGRRRLMDYAILLDGERVAQMSSDESVRDWIAKYREDHAEDDPSAV